MIRNSDEQIQTEQHLDLSDCGTPSAPCDQIATLEAENKGKNSHFRYLTTPDVAQMFQKTARTITTWVSEGRLPAMKIGRSILFDPDDVRVFMREHYRVAGREVAPTCHIKARASRRNTYRPQANNIQ